MSQTISGAVTLGVTFGPGYISPLTIASSGNVSNQNYSDAVSAPSSYVNPTLINQGTVTGGTYDGVSFGNGGYVNNSGRIQGYLGVVMSGTGTITNSGTILGSGAGVALYGGGTVTNTAGKIEGVDGVFITGTYGTVNNSGTITGSGGPGVFLQYGGYVNNSLLVQGFIGVAIDNNGDVVNSGTILGSVWSGVALYGGGTVTNNAGTIQGSEGVYITGNTGTVTNSGTIIGGGGPHGYGVDLIFGGSVDNTNLIKGHTGVYVYGPGTITNSGTILGTGASGIGVDLKGGGNTLINPGTISSPGTSGVGVLVVDGTYGPSTLINSGTISGGSGTAVYFAGTGDLLVVDPGAVFVGNVYGGASDTIELGSASSEGTLLGLGSSFVNFGTVTVDVGAYWTLTGSFRGVLENAGTLASVPSPGLYLNGTVINTGSLAAPFYIQTNGYLTNQSLGIIAGSCDAGAVVADNATVVNAGTIDNTGNVGPGAGVYLQGASDQVTNNTGGLIEGRTGVGAIVGSDVTITNAGTLDGLGTAGYGILLQGSGTVDNTGLITAAGANGIGIDIKSGGSVDNYANGTISGGAVGISISGSAGTVTNDGTIVGTSGDGIDLTAGGTVGNTNWIEGYTGVLITGALGTVTNSGTIEGTGVNVGRGVYLRYGGGVYNNAGLIKGLGGIYIIGSAGTVTNAGTVEGNYAAVILGTGGSVDNTGLIAGGHRGVEIDSYTGAVTNSSTIIGTASYAIILKDGGSVGNSGLIEGYRGVYIGGTSGTVTNSGTIVGTQGYSGILLEYGGSVANNAGLIEGPDGVEVNQASGTVANSGTIIGTGSYGVYLKAGGSVSNDAGLIQGYDNGVYITGSAGGTVSNSGTILGMIKDGVYLQTYGSVGNTSTAGLIQGSGYGVRINGTAGTVTNGGTILGTSDYGVYLRAGSVTNNGGLIEGAGGVVIEGSATLTNFGTILGTIGYGVFLGGGGGVYNNAGLIEGWGGVKIVGAAGTVTNAGTIIGTASYGVDFAVGGSTLVNAGTIEGSGDAVRFAGSGNLVIVDPGAVFTGAVYGGTGSDTLELGSAAGIGTLSGLGTEYLGFQAVTVDAGAQWALSGNNTIGTGVTLSDLGTLTNAGSLSGSGTFIVDPATLYNTGYIGMTVTLSGGGYLDNEAGGTIAAAGIAAYGTGGAPTIVNASTILGTSGDGVDFTAGGSVANIGTAALIEGYGAGNFGVRIGGAAGTVTNAGTIANTIANAVYLQAGGAIVNSGTILSASDGYAVVVGGAGSVTNSLSGYIDSGVGLPSGGTVVNDGRIVSTNVAGIGFEIVGSSTAGTVANYGTVIESGTRDAGVYLGRGGSVANNGGLIEGFRGVYINDAAGTVTNSGTILGTGGSAAIGAGIYLKAGGAVSNSGSILSPNSYDAVFVKGAAGSLTNSLSGYIGSGGVYLGAGGNVANDGRIVDTYSGGVAVRLVLAGTVTNSGTILSTHFLGVDLDSGGTVVDSGTIGGNGTAIRFGGTGNNLFGLEAGYKLYGGVSVAGSGNTLELLGTAGAVSVDFDKSGASFTNFGTVAFGGAYGNDEILTISDTLTGLPGTISGFNQFHDIVDLTQLNPVGAHATLGVGNMLVVSNGSQSVSLQLGAGDYSGIIWQTSPDSGSGTDVEPACFCRGTLILTDRGEVAVEELAIGDLVVTLSGEAKPIRWIGRRGYDGRFVAGNRAVLPIRVMEGALGDGVPARDLWLSPEHALYIEGALVPAGLLVNGASILQAEEVDEVEYFHIELDRHDVIFADGAPAESFIDDDSRGVFHNAAEFYALYPDAPARVPPSYCAPRLEEGFELEALRRRLLGRARRLGAGGTAPPGVLRGCLELVGRTRIDGWAIDPVSPDTPVGLVILANGAEIGRVVANRYRRDLDEAGIGDGRHAFELVVPGGLAAGVRHEIEVRREADWHVLFGSPAVLEPVAVRFEREPPRSPAAASPPLGALRGSIDSCDGRLICGWAQDSADPERRVGLLVKLDDQVIGRVLANRFRADLEADGIGDGRHAFELPVPNGLSPLEAHEIRIEREADGAELPGSPWTLPAAHRFDAAIEQHLADIFAGAAAGAAEDRTLAFLTEQTDRLLARRAARDSGSAERNAHRLFRRRWGLQGTNDSHSLGAPRLRALVVDSSVPCATRDAGSVAILSHVRAFRGLGYEVSFAASDEMGNEAALAMLAAAEGIATCGGPHYSCLEDVLCRQAGTFDVVYLHRIENADRYLPLARRYCPKARILYSVADLHHLRIARQAQVERRPELLARSRHLAAVEFLAARRADIVITHSPVEADLLRREAGFGKVHVVPFAVPPRPPRRPFAERHGLAILGSFEHAPNPDAVHHLVSDILPLVWAREPTLGCKIVGHGWHAGRLPHRDPRIEMIGAVADLDEVFDTVRLTVAPLRFGAGIKGKVVDSFAAGLPCVMTPIAAEGLALTGSLPQLVSEDPTELAELIVRFHADRRANDQVGLDGARLAAQQFSAERVIDLLREVLTTPSSNKVANDHRSSSTTKMTAIA